MTRVGLSTMECGSCRHPEAMTMRGAPWSVVRFPSIVGVIRHPTEGIVLFDTGYDRAFLEATRPFPERLYRITTPVELSEGDSAAERLRAMDIDPADVRHVVLSHFHGDHVAGLHGFPTARIHCSRAGLEDLNAHGRIGATRRGLLPALVPDRISSASFFEDARRIALPGAFRPFEDAADLFGDGSLLAVELPGHCPGHWGLAMALEDGRDLMMVADAAWSIEAIERDAPPPSLTARLLGDAARHRATLSSLHDLRRRNPGMPLIPSHCRRAHVDAGLSS